MIPLEFLWLMFLSFDAFGGRRPENVLLVADEPDVAEGVDTVQRIILVVFLSHAGLPSSSDATFDASAPLRRVLAPGPRGRGRASRC